MARPTVIPFKYSEIPEELRESRSFVGWRLIPGENGKDRKVPFAVGSFGQVDGHADTTDPNTWAMADECDIAYSTGEVDGVGFVFAEDDPYCGIDLDKVRDPETGQIEPWVEELVEKFKTYTELSQSGSGLHLLLKGKLPGRGRRKNSLEVYDKERFFVVTGCRINDFEIRDCQDELDELLQQTFGVDDVSLETVTIGPTISDEELLNKAFSAKNGQHIKELFNGSIYGYQSPSEADLALANYLSFYSSDYGQIERLMHSSNLPNKPKWEERPVLLRLAINKALKDTHNKYQGAVSVTPPTLSFLTAKELCESTPDEPDWIVEGFISVGVLTEMNGKPKDGKTTISFNMIEKVINGKDFLGKPTKKTRVIYLSEERNTTLSEALRKAGLEDSEDIKILKYVDKGHATWEEVIQSVRKEAIAFGAGLLFVDTLFNWTEVDEREGGTNSASTALKSMRPLQLATGDGLAVVVLRHDRKSGGGIADSAGGSTQYTGASDIVLHIGRVNANKTIREIKMVGRLGLPDDIYVDYQDGQYFITDITAVALHQGLQAVLDLEPFTEPQAREFWEALGASA